MADRQALVATAPGELGRDLASDISRTLHEATMRVSSANPAHQVQFSKTWAQFLRSVAAECEQAADQLEAR